MPRSDEAEWWFNAVYSAVQEIPRGRVTSYGHIATLLGRPQCPRQVGVCLKHLPAYTASNPEFYNSRSVPWQRVINAKGGISPRGPGSAERQAVALRREGVTVSRGAMGEFTVEFAEYGWFPSILPSEAADEEGASQEDDEDDGEEEESRQERRGPGNASASAGRVRNSRNARVGAAG